MFVFFFFFSLLSNSIFYFLDPRQKPNCKNKPYDIFEHGFNVVVLLLPIYFLNTFVINKFPKPLIRITLLIKWVFKQRIIFLWVGQMCRNGIIM